MSEPPVTPKVSGYDMGCMVGQGTQGCVYKATTRGRDRARVAVKVVLKSRLSQAGRDNLVTEIALLKKLKHRFIVSLVDFHWDDRNIYIVTEFCSGGDLSSAIKAKTKLPEAQVQRLAQQLAAALRYLRLLLRLLPSQAESPISLMSYNQRHSLWVC